MVDFDTLGRPFQTTDDNAAEGKYTVHQTLDIAGRPIVITDAKGRQMTTHVMGMVNPFKTTNIDSGSRWTVNDVAGKPLYGWDSRNHQIKHTYDQLQRPTLVTLGDLSALVVEKTVYGTDPTKNNIGQVQYIYDQSGKQEIESYDFKGNPLKTIKQFCENYQSTINWEATPAPTLKTETFIQQITYDALNRPLTQTQPDNTVIEHTYNEAGLLETVKKDAETFVTNINYNEKGQRTDIYYGNGSKTRYYYNPLNFRLTRMLTTRNTGSDILQDLNYTYDPVGNIVEVVDNAQQIHYFSNSVIEPRGMYKYDALYRLVEAQGRELTSLQLPTHEDFPNNIAVPNTAPNALQNYTLQYQYDQLGNILQMKSVGNWTRDYFYNTNDNRLLGHTNGVTEYTCDAHGNITTMPHLAAMNWDYKDQLLGATNGTFSSYYIYDSSSNRTRKVVVKGNIVEERYYLGNYEVYRKTNNGTLEVERSTVHVSDDQKRIAQIDDDGTTETIRYQYDNHLGSASLELDESAAIISYEEYHPFGTTSYRSGRTETEVSMKKYKYVGKERDEETGLYYFGARYYAAWLARWTATDPLKEKYLHLSPYNYVANNPIKFIDPDGRKIVNAAKEGTKEWLRIKTALEIVAKTNPELFKRLESLEEIIPITIGKLNPENFYGAHTKPTGRIEYGVSEYEYNNPERFEVKDIIYDDKNEPVDAKIYGKKDGNTVNIELDSLWDVSGQNTEKYNELKSGFSFEKEFSKDEASKTVKLNIENGIIASVILDPLNISDKSFAKTLAHELGHIDFAMTKTVIAWIWSKIGNPNHPKGKGHDDNNPSGNAALEAENECLRNYDKK